MVVDRKQILAGFERKYADFISELTKSLENQQFIFQEQQTAHLDALDKRLVIRHALPYCITEETFFEIDDSYIPFFTAVILLHTLALTKIDDYYDGGYKTKSPHSTLNISSLAYSLSATHQSLVSLLKKAPNSFQLAELLNVTNFVHSRMYKDSTERYNPMYLIVSENLIDEYLHGKHSRLLGSGYYEVMARASFVQRGKAFPKVLHSLDLKLRKFRQIIDELEDVAQDLAGGLVTLPTMHLLIKSEYSNSIKKTIQDSWKRDEQISAEWLDKQFSRTETKQWIYSQAKEIYDEAMAQMDSSLASKSEGYEKLFNYKLAKLDLLMAQ